MPLLPSGLGFGVPAVNLLPPLIMLAPKHPARGEPHVTQSGSQGQSWLAEEERENIGGQRAHCCWSVRASAIASTICIRTVRSTAAAACRAAAALASRRRLCRKRSSFSCCFAKEASRRRAMSCTARCMWSETRESSEPATDD